MADIRAHLERKKAKLQALREEKERLRKEKEQKEVEDAALRAAKVQKDVDELLSSLGAVSLCDLSSDFPSPDACLLDQNVTRRSLPQMFSPASGKYSTPKQSGHSQRVTTSPRLTVSTRQIVNIAPQKAETYMKYTQTDTVDLTGCETEDADTSVTLANGGTMVHGLPCVKDVEPAHSEVEQTHTQRVYELSNEEKQKIILSEEFQYSFDRAARLMERALSESTDIYTDYCGATQPLDEKSSVQLFLNRCFYEERWSRNRCVTSLSWSPNFPELLAASYHRNEDSPNEPDGVCLIWNTKYKKTTPEYIFHCRSPVLSSTFSRFHPNLVLGGTYSGQIVVWDNRVRKHTPVQRTPLSDATHTHPVFCLSVVGSKSAENLISVSTDGRLCSWSLEMLSQPQDRQELEHKQLKTVVPSCIAFPANSSNNFILGSQNGSVYSACLHGRKAGITKCYEGHELPVTGVSTNAVQGGMDFSHLFLTSSFDWTVKLWSMKESKPLYSFEDNGDCVYDVAWSPTHPALFAAVDGTGRLSLWNLNEDTEIPTASVMVDGSPALNQVSWASSGLQVIVGDDMGRIWVYGVSEHLANPRGGEWSNFAQTLLQLKNRWTDHQ